MTKLKVEYVKQVDPDAEGEIIDSCYTSWSGENKVKIKKKDGSFIKGTDSYDKDGREVNPYKSKKDDDLMGW